MTTEAVDTSVVVAALLGWHEAHEPARRALERVFQLPDPLARQTQLVRERL